MQDINKYSTPINRTAGLVTQQSTPNDLDNLIDEQQNIKRAAVNLRASLLDAKNDLLLCLELKDKNQESVIRRNISKIKNKLDFLVESEMPRLKVEIKNMNISLSGERTRADWIVKEVASMFSKDEFEAICHRANQRRIEHEFKQKGE